MTACVNSSCLALTRDTSACTYHGVTQQDDTPETPTGTESAAVTDDDAATAPAAAPESSNGEREAASKKERVLHTRVPIVLERELKRFAENLRIPVSNLIRTILEDAVDMADAAGHGVEEQLKSAARSLELERERLRKKVRIDPLADVFAFQAVTLAQRTRCTLCGIELLPGTRAHLGLSDGVPSSSKPRVFVCEACLPKSP
jgi:hypothetical protein